jgi:hypothetical protein
VAACGHGALFGTIPDTPFLEAQAASGGRMLERWWRAAARSPEGLAELPTREDACRIAVPPWDAGPTRTSAPGSPADEATTTGHSGLSWWNAWRPWVFYSLGAGFEPASPGTGRCDAAACLQLVDAGGTPLANDKQFAVIVARGCPGPSVCSGDAGCNRVTVDARGGNPGHVLVAFP